MSLSVEKAISWRPSLGAWSQDGRTHFRVWAPKASSVELVLETPGSSGPVHSLSKDSQGYFSTQLDTLASGDLYRYRIDGKGPYPDPASRFQPQGVHGPSMLVDPSAFSWSDSAWPGYPLERLVFYELHIGTFTPEGTFAAAAEKLPLLQELGVTAIEIMPVADFPGRWNWGYDGVDLFAPARCYGTPDDLRKFVDEAHARDLAVFMDVVYNHLGPDGAYLGVFSPFYFTDRHKSPWGAGVNLDGDESSKVRSFFIENAQHWIHEYHMDGLRLDATHAMVDESRRHFLSELTDEVKRSVHSRPIHLIAEDNRNLSLMIKPEKEGGWGLDGLWADDFHHEMRRFLSGDHEGYFAPFGGTIQELAETIQRGWFFKESGDRPYSQYVICLQNHDQTGNRAFGERFHHDIDLAAYRAASAVLLFCPETPLLFMGQEWAVRSPFQYFTDHNPELGKLVTEGRRKEFEAFSAFQDPAKREKIPDPQSPSTFQASKLKWEEREKAPGRDLWHLYRTLLHLRQKEPVLHHASRDHVQAVAVNESILAVRRWNAREEILLVACLRGTGSVHLSDAGLQVGSPVWTLLFNTEDSAFAEDSQAHGILVDAGTVTFKRPGAVLLKTFKE